MGVVYHARDPFLERDVALKVMLPQISDDPEQKHRFEREARAVARMMHPNVVTIFDLGYHSDGSPYIAMELLRGQDLQQALRDGPELPPERTLAIIAQVLEGVGHAHRAGIVHRDIKPANTFLNHDATVKIMDFGVARFTAASMTATGIVVGTANYMAPEQVNGARVDGRADLFSVGCMLYEMLLRRRPFEAETLMSTLWKIVHEEPAFDAPAGSGLERLVPVLRRALAKLPEQRYQTAADFAADLCEPPKGMSTPAGGAAGSAPGPAASEGGATLDLKRAALPLPAARPEPRPAADPTPLFRLMREIQTAARSGHLHFTHGRERRSLRIVRGGIVHGTSDVAGQHLGDILVRYGLLGHEDLQQAIAVVLRERKRLGTVLTERGAISPERLGEAIAIHIREILSDVAGRSDGSFAFEDLAHDALPEGEAAPALPIGEVILEAARRIQSPEIVGRVLGNRDRVLSLSTHPLLRSQKLTLTPTDGFLLSRVDGATSVTEVFRLIPLPMEDVERSLFALLCTGIVEYVGMPADRSAALVFRPRPSLARDAAADLEKSRVRVLPPLPRTAPAAPPPPAAAPARPSVETPRPAPEAASLHVESAPDAESVLDAIRDAHRLLRDERAWDAIQRLEPLVPNAEGHARFRIQVTLARAYLKNPKWTKRAEELLHGVVRDAPEHAEAYVVLGNIYRSGQLRARALAMYQRALALQPGLPEALEGMADLTAREAPQESASLMRKLFRKASG
jgi:hypothetical protein